MCVQITLGSAASIYVLGEWHHLCWFPCCVADGLRQQAGAKGGLFPRTAPGARFQREAGPSPSSPDVPGKSESAVRHLPARWQHPAVGSKSTTVPLVGRRQGGGGVGKVQGATVPSHLPRCVRLKPRLGFLPWSVCVQLTPLPGAHLQAWGYCCHHPGSGLCYSSVQLGARRPRRCFAH